MIDRFTFRLTQLLIAGIICLIGFHSIGISPARSQSPASAEVQQAIGAEPGSVVLEILLAKAILSEIHSTTVTRNLYFDDW